MTWQRVFLVVTLCALAGMCLGGLFGYAGGSIAPSLFQQVFPWRDVEPVGAATVMGATAGVLLGGALGCFGVLVQLLQQRSKHRTDE